jgi:hypothetical protein
VTFYGFLADMVVAFHVAYVAFVVVGQLLILLGWLLGWKWIRNFWFRLLHLLAIGIVAFESMATIVCPLTTLESYLREQAGQEVSEASFMGRFLHALIFHDYPQSYFDIGNVVFALLVILTFWLARPNLPKFLRRDMRLKQNAM